jgi:large subunit ribosomal protein L3
MKFILAKKLHMTQVFADNGKVTPATVLESTPMTVTRLKTSEKDGYEAVQVGFGVRKASRISKSVAGQTKDLGNFATIREYKAKDGSSLGKQVGEKIDVSTFAPGDTISVSAISKGKGFQGVVKRHGFGGGPRSHGQKHSEREAGSIGGGLRNKVPKGMRMAGRMGGERVTVRNLVVLQADPANNLIVVSGAIPGRRGTLVELRG